MLSAKLLHGNAYARIIRPSIYSNQIIGLEWLHPRRVTVMRKDGQLIYMVQADLYNNDASHEQAKVYLPADMLHIPGPGFNGLIGMSQIRYVLRNSAGIALAADQYSADFFQNGARADFAITHPGNPTKEQRDAIRESWAERHNGLGKNHLPALLAGGMDIKELTMNAEDTQLIATRQFQVGDIARIFGIPPHMIGLTDQNTSWGTGVEQMSLGFRKYTLAPHLAELEQELNRKVWPVRSRYLIEFDPTDLERGDYKTRTDAYRSALGRAGEQSWMTPNEVRKSENMAPIDGGDKLFHEIEPTDATLKTPTVP